VQNDRHYFEVYINENDDVYAYIYLPINKVKRCVCLDRTSGDIYYLHLLLLHKPSHRYKDNLTYITVGGGGEPLVCASYQQSALHMVLWRVLTMSDQLLMTCLNLEQQHNAGATL
jgi:hypothetical protein